MQTLTLAEIYAKQGYLEEAREIYRAILKREPENEAARMALEELSSETDPKCDEEMLALFNSLADEVELKRFERWLIQPWN
ncbi:MAG: hypothetical protein B6D59_03245 [Campylobacteraceae bacterium 4484_4]|nr:MAG: hypothetical protein B6D59_03245 [Campylobacteraceae bacterium 4484_4]